MTNRNAEGAVIWITGLSGAGKTTIGRLVHDALMQRNAQTIFLDGDELRTVFEGGHKFDRDSRLSLALSYGRLCLMLARQGFTVVCATISMRREVYSWNRANLPGYTEIYLDVADEIRHRRDPKRYYAQTKRGKLNEFAGHDQGVDLPENPHIRLQPGAHEPPQETAHRLITALQALPNGLSHLGVQRS
jgi:adenylylsulfate kinase